MREERTHLPFQFDSPMKIRLVRRIKENSLVKGDIHGDNALLNRGVIAFVSLLI